MAQPSIPQIVWASAATYRRDPTGKAVTGWLGGVNPEAPYVEDMNGLLNNITDWLRWVIYEKDANDFAESFTINSQAGQDADLHFQENSVDKFTLQYNHTSSRLDVISAGGSKGISVGSNGGVRVGPDVSNGFTGAASSVRTGDVGSTIDYLPGELCFGNTEALLMSPGLSGTTTDNNAAGVSIIAATSDTNSTSDFIFNVFENNVSDFSTLTSKAYQWKRWATELMSLSRDGILDVSNDIVTQNTKLSSIVDGVQYSKDYASLNAAVAAIGIAETTLKITDALSVTGPVTVPSNITLQFERGGSLTAGAAQIVTINSEVVAGLWRVFGANINVAGLTVNAALYPQWWGAAGDGLTDDTVSINKALAFGKSCVLSEGTYLIADRLNLVSDSIFEGTGKAVIKYSTKESCINCDGISQAIVRNIEVNGNNTAYAPTLIGLETPWGVRIHEATGITVSNMYIHDVYRIGISLGHDSLTPCQDITVCNNKIEYVGGVNDPIANFGNGIAVVSCIGARIFGNTVTNISGSDGAGGLSAATGGINIEPGNVGGQIQPISDIFITGNFVEAITNAYGIGFYSPLADADSGLNVTIENNVVKSTGTAYGLSIYRTYGNVRVKSNELISTNGILIRNCLTGRIEIEDNIVNSATGYGLRVQDGAFELFISKNVIKDVDGKGMYIDMYDAGTTMSQKYCDIVGNVLRSITEDAIIVAAGNLKIVGNTLYGCCTDGGLLSYISSIGGNSVCYNGEVSNNVFNHVGAAIAKGYIDIQGNMFNDVYFCNNVFVGTTVKFSTFALACRIPGAILGSAPGGGTWKVGDIVYRDTPATTSNSQPNFNYVEYGWQCSVAGSPGTWKSLINITEFPTRTLTTESPVGDITPGNTGVFTTVVSKAGVTAGTYRVVGKCVFNPQDMAPDTDGRIQARIAVEGTPNTASTVAHYFGTNASDRESTAQTFEVFVTLAGSSTITLEGAIHFNTKNSCTWTTDSVLYIEKLLN